MTTPNPETAAPVKEKPPQGKEAAQAAKRYVAEARRNLAEQDKKVDKSKPQTERASDNLQFLEGFVNGMPVADLKGDKIVIAQRRRPDFIFAVGIVAGGPGIPVIVKGEIYVDGDRQVMYKKDSRYNPKLLDRNSLPVLLSNDRKLYGRFADMSQDAILARVEKGIK
jgi:hypothetical protein